MELPALDWRKLLSAVHSVNARGNALLSPKVVLISFICCHRTEEVALQVTESRAGAVTSNRGRVSLADLTPEQTARVEQLQGLHAERFPLVPAISWDLLEGAEGPVTESDRARSCY